MKVSIRTDGHTVEIETTEPGMNVHRLANIAVNTWRRTVLEASAPGFGGAYVERRERLRTGRWGGRFGFADPPLEAS